MSALPANTAENEQLVSYEALAEHTGFSEPAAIRDWLTKNRIRYFLGKRNRPFTTLKAFNSGLGLDVDASNESREISL